METGAICGQSFEEMVNQPAGKINGQEDDGNQQSGLQHAMGCCALTQVHQINPTRVRIGQVFVILNALIKIRETFLIDRNTMQGSYRACRGCAGVIGLT